MLQTKSTITSTDKNDVIRSRRHQYSSFVQGAKSTRGGKVQIIKFIRTVRESLQHDMQRVD